MSLRVTRFTCIALLGSLLAGCTHGSYSMSQRKSDSPPRKVVVATVMKPFTGTVDERLSTAEKLIDDAAGQAKAKYAGRLDLVVLPEHAIQTEKRGVPAAQRAVKLEGPVLDRMAAKARQHRTYLVVGVTRDTGTCYYNSAALLDRDGKLIGVYDKVHLVGKPGSEQLEGGIRPGSGFPVFDTDFGKVGFQICWDMSYDNGFAALADAGAEIVAITSASPQTVRPASLALKHRYWVVTATPRDNATIFNPAGQVAAQTTRDPVLVHEIDLAFAVLHWQERLQSGQLLAMAYGEAVGYQYSDREDTGVFWSNDPAKPIGVMLKEQSLREMDDHIEADRKLQEKLRR
jgi:predicted amidohydrolase